MFVARLESPTLRAIVNYCDTRISLDQQGKGYSGYDKSKLIIYSAHDTNISNMLLLFNKIFKDQHVKLYDIFYSSTLFIELYGPEVIDSSVTPDDYNVHLTFNDHLLFKMNYSKFKDAILPQLLTDEQIQTFCGW